MHFSRFVSHISSAWESTALPKGWSKLGQFHCSSNSRRTEVDWKKILLNPQQKNDTPCKRLQAILFRFSNVEMFQQYTILIIHKIILLPHVVLNAAPHLHSLPCYPQLFVGRRNVTTVQPGWGTRPTAKCPYYSDSSEKHKKLCPKATVLH